MNRIAMVPCAGFGTRMGRYTESIPKPLLRVNGIPLLFYTLFLLHLWDVHSCVINLHYKASQIREALRDFPWFRIFFSEEQGQILGTSGGIRQAMDLTPLSGWFLFINPDTIFWPSIDPFTEAADLQNTDRLQPPSSFLYLSPRPLNSTERGFGGIGPFAGNPPAAPLVMNQGDWFYSGMSILHTDAVSHLPPGQPNELRDVFAWQSSHGQLLGRPFPEQGQRIDCGTASEFEQIKSLDPVPLILKDRWKAFLGAWASVQSD